MAIFYGRTADFWYTAQASLLNGQMQVRNQQERDALDAELARNEQAQAELTQDILGKHRGSTVGIKWDYSLTNCIVCNTIARYSKR